jgi:hypothetical protein
MAPMRGLSYTLRCLVTIDPVTSLMGYCLRPSKSGNFRRTKRKSQGSHSKTPEGASLTHVRGTIKSGRARDGHVNPHGDTERYHDLIWSFDHRICRMVLSFMKNPSDAENVAQESFLITTRTVKVRLHGARIIMRRQLASQLEGAIPGKRWLR